MSSFEIKEKSQACQENVKSRDNSSASFAFLAQSVVVNIPDENTD